MSESPAIRAFQARDAAGVRTLFIAVNRLLAPPELRETFEVYIARSLAEEMDRVADYYGERGGGFWVAVRGEAMVGMFGLETLGSSTFELRRMYVDPSARRSGIASAMLRFAEDECRSRGADRIVLSTSELQPTAIALYRAAGYQVVAEVIAQEASNKTIGGGIRRFTFEKSLSPA